MIRLLAALLAWAAGIVMATVPDAPLKEPVQDPAPKATRFSHAQHVADPWLRKLSEPEVWRDCRACHRFTEAKEVSAPQGECNACHVGGGQLQPEVTEGFRDDLSGYRTRTRNAFRHHTHYMLECRECHLPAKRNNVGDFDVVTGPGQCQRCHEQQDAAAATEMVAELRWFRGADDESVAKEFGVKQFTPPAASERAKYADRLVEVFAGPQGGINTKPLPLGSDFDHDDHAQIQCTDCHATIRNASAKGVGTGQIGVGTCGKCHVDGSGQAQAAAPAPRPQSRRLNTLGTFTHADHYRFLQPGAERQKDVCDPQAYGRLEASKYGGCDVCHVQKKAAVGLMQPDFPFETGFSKYTYFDCQGCHAVAGWSTGESASKPLHNSTDGALDDKSGWAACAVCHVPGVGKMAEERPKVAVERRTESTFRFTTHTHPYITTAESARAELGDCAKCHRARVPVLPTRLDERVFRHATHLPAQPGTKDCAGCHPSAEKATTSAALAIDFRTYSTKGCTTCHVGGDVTEVIAGDAAPASRMVVQFPHGPHVNAAACTDCHELDAGGRDVTTKASALACNQCHDHRPDEPGKPAGPKAEGLFAGEATSCVRCHHEPGPAGSKPVEAVPLPFGAPGAADDPRHRIETTVFAGFQQPQFHPLGGKCTECHTVNLAPDQRYPGIRRERVDHVFAVRRGKVHPPDQPSKQPGNCLACHWRLRDGLPTAVRADDELRKYRVAPDASETRQRYGNKTSGYPGEKGDG